MGPAGGHGLGEAVAAREAIARTSSRTDRPTRCLGSPRRARGITAPSARGFRFKHAAVLRALEREGRLTYEQVAELVSGSLEPTLGAKDAAALETRLASTM